MTVTAAPTPVSPAPTATDRAERHFNALLFGAAALGAVVRLTYVLRDHRWLIGGDGFDYHLTALRLADGLGYTSAAGDTGAPYAHHPPGWVTLLGVVSWLGGRSTRAHQLVGVVIGIGIVVVAGFIGRRYFNARVGVIAAVLAAIYPGFWVLEGNILSEPLGLLVLGLLILAVAGLRDRPTLGRSIGVGALSGLLALVRAEQLFLLLIVVVPVLLLAGTLTRRQRATFIVAAGLTCGLVIAPWTIYNSTRFQDPVFLSTNDGSLLLIGNCPSTYRGTLLGYYDSRCNIGLAMRTKGDRSVQDRAAASQALHNISHNLGRLPVVVPARFGRLLALYRPSQTVGFVAGWMATRQWLIWAWVVSYLSLLPLAIVGAVQAFRRRMFILPLVGPLLIVFVTVTVSYGEPRYHSPSDLGVIVLAAFGIDRLVARRGEQAKTTTPSRVRLPSLRGPERKG